MDDIKFQRISKRIKSARHLCGYSQAFMADQLGISQNVYSKNERNVKSVPLARIFKIALILEVPVHRLLE
jgi:transcriptional regulator with XRE-family HTH domain